MLDAALPVSVVCEVDGSAYIIDIRGEKPCLFRYSLEQGTTEFLARVEKMDATQPKMTFVGVTHYRGRIYFVPKFLREVDYIIIYEIESRELRYQEIHDENFAPYCGYESLHRIGAALWLFPSNLQHDVAVLSLETMELSHIGTWSEAARNVQEQLGREVKSGDAILLDGSIYTPLADSDAILAMSLKDKQTQVCRLGHDIRQTFPIAHDGESFWTLCRRNEGLIQWNYGEGVKAAYDLSSYRNSRSASYHGWFQKIYCSDGAVWLLPKNDSALLRVDAASGLLRKMPFDEQAEELDLQDRQYWVAGGNGRYRVYPFYRPWLLEITLRGQGDCGCRRVIPLPEGWEWTPGMSNLYAGVWKRGGVIVEDSPQLLVKFIRNIAGIYE